MRFENYRCILVSQTTDIYYILNREIKNSGTVNKVVKTIIENMTVLNVNKSDAKAAINSDMPDYEDSLLAYRAKRAKAELIITRNVKDFLASPVTAISPANFLDKYFS